MEFIRRATNWINYNMGRSNLRPYYAFGFEILIGPETNQLADELYIQGIHYPVIRGSMLLPDGNTILLKFWSVYRDLRDGIIHNGNFIETKERYILCNSGRYYTLSMNEINFEVIGDPETRTVETVYGEEIFSGNDAYHIVKLKYQPALHVLNRPYNKFMYGYMVSDEIFIDLETLEPIPATQYLFENTQVYDYERDRRDVFIINGRTYHIDPKYNYLAENDVLYARFTGLYLCGEIYVALYLIPIQLYPVNLRTKAAVRDI